MRENHVGLVYHIAHQIAARLPDGVEACDLIGAGALGLSRAMKSFDATRGLSFSTYATPRIRGAILDDLREQDTVPRSVRHKMRLVRAAEEAVERRCGRTCRPWEIAAELGLSMETYWDWRGSIDRTAPVGLEEPAPEGTGATIGDCLADPGAAPDECLDREELASRLSAALETLDARERLVIALSFYEELSQKQIAEVLKVTESRVSQIRTQALRNLREKLEAVREAL